MKDLHSECQDWVDSLVGKLPLVLKTTSSISNLEIGDSHNEVVNKLNGDLKESTQSWSKPALVDDEVGAWGLDIVRVEDDLAEMNVGDFYI